MRRLLIHATAAVAGLLVATEVFAQPNIDSKSFAVDCRRMNGNTQTGLLPTKEPHSGFTLVLSNASHAFYNAPGKSGLRYWVVAGDVQQLKPTDKPVAAFGTRKQTAQLYGAMKSGAVYTIFITYNETRNRGVSARTVIKGRRCGPYVEPGKIPNILNPERPLHLARLSKTGQ